MPLFFIGQIKEEQRDKVPVNRRPCICPVLILAALLGLGLVGPNVLAAPNEPPGEDRPVIGIALGGGGARGLAHIGVLERLDELRIPVDRIAGTSMGAVVGAFVALGFTPQELEQDALSAHWRWLMTDRPDRRHLSFRRKTDENDNIWPFELGLTRYGVVTQRGMISGQKFNLIFHTPDLYTAGYSGFDELPVPFRPVAVDVDTGEIVVPDRGNLLRAVRASMAAPGAFPPVRIDDRDLVDGFLRAMVPVDAVREMGAEKVIAVHVGWSPGEKSRDGPLDLPGILMRGYFIQTYANTAPSMAAADIPISVSLPGIALHDFTQAEVAIAAGRRAVDEHLDQLLPLALSEDDYARWRAGVRRRTVSAPTITGIRIEDLAHVSERTISDRIRQDVGDTLDFTAFAEDMERIFALGVFETVDFSLYPGDNGSELLIQPTEKPYLPWILRFGASYRMNNQNRGQIQFISRVTRFELNRLGGELRGDLALGKFFGGSLEFYQPLEFSRTLFIAPATFFNSHQESVFEGSYRLGSYRVNDWGGRLDLGLNLGRVGELRAGLVRGQAVAESVEGSLDLQENHEDVGALRFWSGFDRLDNHAIPRSGLAGGMQAWLARPGLGDVYEFGRYWGYLTGAATTGKWTLQLRTQAGGSEGEMPYYRKFLMGGLRDLTGIADGSLRGGAFAMAGAGTLYHLSDVNLPYATQWYLGAWVDVGNTWEKPAQISLRDSHVGGALTFLWETALGPLEMGYGYSSIGRDSFYLQAGIHFAQPLNR